MTNEQIIKQIKATDYMTLCQTVYGEARGEKTQGRIAVVHVILNRVKAQTYFGKTVGEVCLKGANNNKLNDEHFSCWGDKDSNRQKMIDLTWNEAELQGIFHDVKLALNWWKIGKDVTDGSRHYHAKGRKPYWAKDTIPCKRIGEHLFYNDIN